MPYMHALYVNTVHRRQLLRQDDRTQYVTSSYAYVTSSYTLVTSSYTQFIGVNCCVKSIVEGPFTLIYIYAGELMPSTHRGTAVCVPA